MVLKAISLYCGVQASLMLFLKLTLNAVVSVLRFYNFQYITLANAFLFVEYQIIFNALPSDDSLFQCLDSSYWTPRA